MKETDEDWQSVLRMLLLLVVPVATFILYLNLAIYQTDVPACKYNGLYQRWAYWGIAVSVFWGIFIFAFWPDFDYRKIDYEKQRCKRTTTAIVLIPAVLIAIQTLNLLVEGIFLI